MSVFKLVNETKVKGKVKKIFNDIKKTRNILQKEIKQNPRARSAVMRVAEKIRSTES